MSGPDRMPHDLDRFISAQQGVYDGALAELRSGRKTGHWIWFILPQLAAAHPEVRSVRAQEDMKNPGWISSRDFRCG